MWLISEKNQPANEQEEGEIDERTQACRPRVLALFLYSISGSVQRQCAQERPGDIDNVQSLFDSWNSPRGNGVAVRRHIYFAVFSIFRDIRATGRQILKIKAHPSGQSTRNRDYGRGPDRFCQ